MSLTYHRKWSCELPSVQSYWRFPSLRTSTSFLRFCSDKCALSITAWANFLIFQVDGTVVIFDIETNGVARKLQGHTRQIQSIRYRCHLSPSLRKTLTIHQLVKRWQISTYLVPRLEMYIMGSGGRLATANGKVRGASIHR